MDIWCSCQSLGSSFDFNFIAGQTKTDKSRTVRAESEEWHPLQFKLLPVWALYVPTPVARL